MTGPPKKYNPARRQAEALVNLARSYRREGVVKRAAHVEAELLRAAQAEAELHRPAREELLRAALALPASELPASEVEVDLRWAQATAGPEALRLAADALVLNVEVLIRAIESSLPDDTRVRAGVMHRLAGALAAAFQIGSWHFNAGELQDKARLGFRSKVVMRESPRAIARAESNARRKYKLQSDIRSRSWRFRLADSIACAIKVRKALGYAGADEWPSLMAVRRAIAAVLKTTPKKV